MIQQELFFQSPTHMLPNLTPLPPSVPVQTSIEAAEKIMSKTERMRKGVLSYIRSCGMIGATREEIHYDLDMSENSMRPRVWELLGNNGYPQLIKVRDKKRRVQSGNWAEVLVVI